MYNISIIRLEGFKPEFSIESLLEKLTDHKIPKAEKRLRNLADEARPIANPQAFALVSSISTESLEENQVRVGEAVFNSRLMREKIGDLNRAFPFIATEGRAMADWADGLDDELDRLLARVLREAAVKGAQLALEKKIGELLDIPVLSCMNPGSIPQWPIEEQATLFQSLKPHIGELDIRLLPSMFLDPGFSVSGVYFQTDKKYYNCQLCPRENCPNRKANRES